MKDHSPRLHVIYAGRGDAMYVEWTDKTTQKKQLVLLDGGPLKYQAVLKGERLGGNSAPYSKYLFAAGQRIWKTRFSDKDEDKFQPSIIINSHPHDDHLAGLLAFLRFAFGKMKYDFDFKGHFYQPNCPSSGLKDTRKLLGEEFEWPEGTGFQYEGIQIDYPTPTSILKWDAKPSLGGGPSYDPDDSPENKASILMRTVPDKMKVAGTMYFTGDSVGHIIMEQLKQTPPLTLSIYKIQHHGSMVNTQIQDYCNKIHSKVGYEAVVRGWFRCFVVPYESRKWDAAAPGPRKIMGIIQEKFKKLENMKLQESYRVVLEARHRKYVKDCMLVLAGQKQMKEAGGLDPLPSKVYMAVKAAIKKLEPTDTAYDSFYDDDGKAKEWWKESIDFDEYRRHYLRYTAVGQIKNFFSSFVADAYVISANSNYKHPSPETILGLAMAIKEQVVYKVRTTGGILYVTDGSAIDLPGLQDLALEMGVDWTTLMPSPLTIRVLKNRCFMSLDASDGLAFLNRDTDGATEEISLVTAKIIEGKRLRANVEADTSQLGSRDLGPIFCSIVTPKITTTTTALYLSIATGTPNLIPSGPGVTPPRLLVEYCWITQGSAMKDESEAYHLVLKEWVHDKWKRMDIWIEGVTAKIGKDTETMLYWKDGDNKKAFYIKTSGSGKTIETEDHKSVLPSTYANVFFTIQLDTDQQPVTSPIPKVPHWPQSFRSFCISSALDPTTISNAWKAIEMLTSSEIVKAMGLLSDFANKALNYQIDLDRSVVEYQHDEVSVKVQSAKLIFRIPDNATIKIGSDTFLVKEVTFDLSWNEQDLIKASLEIRTKTEGIEILVKKEVPGAKHVSSLRQSLIGMGVKSEELTNVRLPKLLGYLINSDSKMYSLLYQETPASLLLSGILRLVPDLDRSRARVTMLPGNMPLIHQADIKCNLDTAVGAVKGEPKPEPFNPNITFAGVDLVIQTLDLSVYNATSPDETIVLTGMAKFTATKLLSSIC